MEFRVAWRNSGEKETKVKKGRERSNGRRKRRFFILEKSRVFDEAQGEVERRDLLSQMNPVVYCFRLNHHRLLLLIGGITIKDDMTLYKNLVPFYCFYSKKLEIFGP